MFDFLIPKEYGFFEVFDQHASATVEGAQILVEMLEHFGEAPAKAQRIKIVEHKAEAYAMLIVNSRSSMNGTTGKISTRMVPNSPPTSQRSPYFSRFRILSLNAPMMYSEC